jgi:hypothetical protein
VRQDQITRILSSVKAPLTHPLFFPRIFALAAKNRRLNNKQQDNAISAIIQEEYDELSRRLDRSQIQESCSVRNILRARRLATLLIDDKGELKMNLLSEVIEQLKLNLYSLGPYRQYDAKRQEHLLKILTILYENKDLVRTLKKIGRPFSNKYAEELIQQTLELHPSTTITDAHTRRAILAAWLSYLRQNVGSCFATAPAKIIQEEQPELFLQDMADLLATGRLKRTFSGIEYSVPLSISWGAGDLKKPLLIQIASAHIQPEIWYSPGLMAAFESINFFKKEDTLKYKVNQIKAWLTPFIQHKGAKQFTIILTAEEIIRFIMLQAFGLTEQQLREYESRPKGMVQSQLLMHIPTSSRNFGGIGERCANFLQQFEVAKNAFKGLSDSALLKAWEFTLASFSETKLEFTRWNLYSSLGMGTSEPGGIGQCIYQIIQRKLDVINKKVQEVQYEYEIVFTHVKTLESRMRQASTEKELHWLRVEYQSRANEFYFLEEQRDETQYQAKNLVGLYESLHALYLELFKDYFQEVYDADVQEIITGPFDDSPAGFRLLYKHGRSNTAQWTRIKNQAEFIDALASFFVATEPQVVAALELKKGLEKDLSEIVTAIINHVKTKEFLETAFHRMAAAHHVPLIQDPLEHLDRVEKKPWVYTSGGTMNTLVSCYYRLPDKPKEASKWVESELELLVFLVDSVKHIPQPLIEPYLKKARSALLMQSPTHAFLLKPNIPLFKEAWMSEEFTYTYVRDRFLKPAEFFVERILLDNEMIQFLIQQLTEKVPENFQPRFKSMSSQLTGPLNPIFFREYLVDLLSHDRGLRYGRTAILAEEEIDSMLYSNLPLFPIYELRDRINKILILLPGIDSLKVEKVLNLFDQIPLSRGSQVISANQLQDICKALLCLSELLTSSPYDYHLSISQAAQKLEFAMPTPIIFADTNWVKDEFGFVLNPGTGRFELWRLDYTGSFGYPMTSWKQWVDGSISNQSWGIYVKPVEYGQT